MCDGRTVARIVEFWMDFADWRAHFVIEVKGIRLSVSAELI